LGKQEANKQLAKELTVALSKHFESWKCSFLFAEDHISFLRKVQLHSSATSVQTILLSNQPNCPKGANIASYQSFWSVVSVVCLLCSANASGGGEVLLRF